MNKQKTKHIKRFEFGSNWQAFLNTITEERITLAEMSLKEMLKVETLKGKRFLDAGSGSGLFSLAARRLGAAVHSFDYDLRSVECAKKLRAIYFPEDTQWVAEQGDVLDRQYIESLGGFDVVYSWGVLHHTGNMRQALENIILPVSGTSSALYIAIYNDQGIRSTLWRIVKKVYCSSTFGKILVIALFFPWFFAKAAVKSIFHGKNEFAEYKKKTRGMSIIHDWFDWLGGYPFETAKPEDIVDFYKSRGFVLQNIKTTTRTGNNEFVFRKI